MKQLLYAPVALLCVAASLLGQQGQVGGGITQPGNVRFSATDPTGNSCIVGQSPNITYTIPNPPVDYVCGNGAIGSAGVYVAKGNGAVTTLAASGVGASGAAGANKLTGPANSIVKLDNDGNGAVAVPGSDFLSPTYVPVQTTTSPLYASSLRAFAYEADSGVARLSAGVWQGTWNSGTTYNPGDAVNNGSSGQNFIALQASTNQALPSGTSINVPTIYWAKFINTSATVTPTAFDVFFYTVADLAAIVNSQVVTVKLGATGYTTNTCLQEPDSASAGVNIEGTWPAITGTGLGNRAITQIFAGVTGCSVVLSQPDKTTAILYNFHLSNFEINATNARSCLYISGVQQGTLENFNCGAASASQQSSGFGQVTIGNNACPGGSVCNAFQFTVRNVFIRGNGFPTWATFTPSVSGGVLTATVATGGTYSGGIGRVLVMGPGGGPPCTTMGTASVTQSGGGNPVTGITLTGYSGCIAAASIAISAPDIGVSPWGFDSELQSDSFLENIAVQQIGSLAGIHIEHGASLAMVKFHPFTTPVLIEDTSGGGTFFGPELDDAIQYQFQVLGPDTTIVGAQSIDNGPLAVASSTINLGPTATRIKLLTNCGAWTPANSPLYSLFVQNGVAVAAGTVPSQLTAYDLVAQDCNATTYLQAKDNLQVAVLKAGTISGSGAATLSANGAASTPGLSVTGTPFAGTGTTSTPQTYLNCTGSTPPTTWSTAATFWGINTCSGFAGNFADFHLNGGASLFIVGSDGTVSSGASFVGGASGSFRWGARSRMISPSDGTIEFTNNSINAFTRLQFGGTTSSFGGICISGVALSVCGADGTATVGSFAAPHIKGTSGTPGVAAGGAIGTTPTIAGNDFMGTVTVPSTAVTSGTVATVTFATSYAVAPQCLVMQNGGLVAIGVGHGTPGTGSFTITASIANVSAAAYLFDYICSGN